MLIDGNRNHFLICIGWVEKHVGWFLYPHPTIKKVTFNSTSKEERYKLEVSIGKTGNLTVIVHMAVHCMLAICIS